jgi:hypothetical protein
MITLRRSNRVRRKARYRRRPRRSERRWIVERFFAWLKRQGRLLVHWSYRPNNVLGFVQRAALAILVG